ncbi:segregation and condensation protein A [Streptomyces sp. NRRL S-340]|uniref:segregation and condensation protein A n=1 Tax=Streptomyces sp. NRRL S-340 TaxID=1463901 RepID=UPI001F1ADD1E|nr:segregation/condensation protein A [Streptomyces sp. NRRL S-340]
MTSNDVPPAGPGPAAARRRALGRGPGTSAPPPEPAPPAAPAPSTAPDAPPAPVVPDPADPVPPARRPAPESHAEPEAPAEPAVPAGAGVVPAEPAGPREERTPRPGSPVGTDGAAGAGGTGGADGTGVAEGAPGTGGIGGAGGAGGAEGAGGAASAGTAASDDGVFKVRLANFEGPFDLLLQLISRHKLDVTEIALSKVTDEFMAHLRAMGPEGDLDRTTEFLVVAATLLDLKAARLLPAAEVEDEADLALLEARDLLFARLLQYRAYKQIADIFNGRLDEEARRHPRTVGLEPHHAELLPEVVISIGPEGFARLAVKAMQPKPKPQVYVDHIHAPLVSVQEQAGIVVARLRELGEASFRTLVEDTDDTLTVVARFLALLELYREKAVALDQETALGDLLVRWTGGDGDARTMVTDEFDRPRETPAEPGADDPAAGGPGSAGPGEDEPGADEPRGDEEEKA